MIEFPSTNLSIDRLTGNSESLTLIKPLKLRLVDTHHIPLWKSQSTGMMHWHFNRPGDQSHCWLNEAREIFFWPVILRHRPRMLSRNNNNRNLIGKKSDSTLTHSTATASGRVQTPRDSISAALSCETLLNIAAYGDRATDGSAITATWIISSTNSTSSNVKR